MVVGSIDTVFDDEWGWVAQTEDTFSQIPRKCDGVEGRVEPVKEIHDVLLSYPSPGSILKLVEKPGEEKKRIS